MEKHNNHFRDPEKKVRLIDANALCEGLVDNHPVVIYARNAPTVDAVEVVHGRWIRMDAHKGIEQFKFSVCRSECYVPTCMNEPMYDYCPNCGAKMDGERKDNEKETT
jgi:hypothetical protein